MFSRDERAHLVAFFQAGTDLDTCHALLIASTSGSATLPTATTTEMAMQRSPADP